MKRPFAIAMRALVFLALASPAGVIRAQNELLDEYGNIYFNKFRYQQDYEYHEGSPYLNEEFLPARIDDFRQTNLVRFDAFQGKVEVMADADRTVVLPDEKNFEIKLLDGSNRVFRTLDYPAGRGRNGHWFFEVIREGEAYILYRRESVRFLEEKKAEAYSPERPARFEVSDPEFFLSEPDVRGGALREIPGQRKAFIGSFPDQNRAKEILKRIKADLKSGPGLVAFLTQYYGS